MLGRYHSSSAVESIQKSPDFIGVKTALNPGRAWRQVAGPELDQAALRASLPMDHETAARVDRANRTFWREANAKAEESALIRRHDSPINLTGGYPLPSAPQIDSERATLPARIDDYDVLNRPDAKS
jgi:hypothetical protein